MLLYVCVCVSVCDIFIHISYAYLRSTLYISYRMSGWTYTNHYRSRHLNHCTRYERRFRIHWIQSTKTVVLNCMLQLLLASKKTWKRFCFKKNLKQRWGVVVSFNVRKHMSYKASLSRRKDSSEFSTNWWKLRTALGKQFTSHIISPRRVERTKREKEMFDDNWVYVVHLLEQSLPFSVLPFERYKVISPSNIKSNLGASFHQLGWWILCQNDKLSCIVWLHHRVWHLWRWNHRECLHDTSVVWFLSRFHVSLRGIWNGSGFCQALKNVRHYYITQKNDKKSTKTRSGYSSLTSPTQSGGTETLENYGGPKGSRVAGRKVWGYRLMLLKVSCRSPKPTTLQHVPNTAQTYRSWHLAFLTRLVK